MPLFTKEYPNTCRKTFDPLRKAHIKHQWYIKNKRNGDDTPKQLGRPFFSRTTEKPKKKKMCYLERRRKAIEKSLKKIEERANIFRNTLLTMEQLTIL